MLFGLGDIRMRRLFIEDEDAPAEHKRRAHRRLDTLIGYCETAQCRRRILLNYFGEGAEPCGNCDNCLDQAPHADGMAEAQIILAAIAETGQRFGPAHIVDILRGHETEKVLAKGHHRLASFGAGMALKKDMWVSLIRQLVASGFLTLDTGGHGGIAIADKGHELRRGELSFQYRLDRSRRSSRGDARSGQDSAAGGEARDPALLATLKAVRLRLARERQVPAFVIFSDRTLIDMAERCPRDLNAFAAVNGVGAAKLKDFGQIFLGAIAAHQSGASI
jgi:ATP-dependent DNA helicase RecQ